jgi:hypothetical protein
MKSPNIDSLRKGIHAERETLLAHPLYHQMNTLEDVRRFMESHVFAVWDFMSLLKSLQRELTCTEVPWVPQGNAATRYLINEIVTGEESDVDRHGNRISHFELYLEAMREAGCDLKPIETFVRLVESGKSVSEALRISKAPVGAARFVENTFAVIYSGKRHVMAGVFTFGREDLIPDMFLRLIGELKKQFPGKLDILQYYVERHIEVDGGHHGELALQMTAELCGEDETKWSECLYAVKEALKSRAALWDAIIDDVPVFVE